MAGGDCPRRVCFPERPPAQGFCRVAGRCRRSGWHSGRRSGRRSQPTRAALNTARATPALVTRLARLNPTSPSRFALPDTPRSRDHATKKEGAALDQGECARLLPQLPRVQVEPLGGVMHPLTLVAPQAARSGRVPPRCRRHRPAPPPGPGGARSPRGRPEPRRFHGCVLGWTCVRPDHTAPSLAPAQMLTGPPSSRPHGASSSTRPSRARAGDRPSTRFRRLQRYRTPRWLRPRFRLPGQLAG